MTDTFPFQVHDLTGFPPSAPGRQYRILVNAGSYEYGDIFEEYGYSGNGPSWGEHVRAILEQRDPELLDRLEEDEEADTYLAYADSQETVARFLQIIRPIFADPVKLAAYFSQTDPEDFFE